MKLLGMLDYELRRNAQGDVLGKLGYSVSAHLPQGGVCAWRGNNDTVWFSFPSDALGWLVENVDFDYVVRLVDRHGNCTRVDVAFDDRSGSFEVRDFADAFLNGVAIVTRYRKWREIQSGRVASDEDVGNEYQGHTFYLGSSQSASSIRVYDKRAEMEAKGELEDNRPWVRVEFQARDNVASRLLAHIVEGGLDRLAEVVSSYCQWRVPSEDTNKSRWPVVPFWNALMGSVRRALNLPGRVDSVARSIDWIERQVTVTLVALQQALGPVRFGEVVQELLDGADQAKVRLKLLKWGVAVEEGQ
jgi:DNA relaxase NicK